MEEKKIDNIESQDESEDEEEQQDEVRVSVDINKELEQKKSSRRRVSFSSFKSNMEKTRKTKHQEKKRRMSMALR